jgi:2-oxoglutarate dehydrogenase complex dehydrogenase (E1) component-like enzyme
MVDVSFVSRWNLDAIEAAYFRWRRDPASVDESWRHFFEGFELGASHEYSPAAESALQGRVIPLIDAYRELAIFSRASIPSANRPHPSRSWSRRSSAWRKRT